MDRVRKHMTAKWKHFKLQYLKGHILNSLYNQTFETVRADTKELREETFRLRYQVFCIENNFLNLKDYSDKMERDEFDDHSKHILLRYRPTGEFIGSMRVILPHKDKLERTFPVQETDIDHPLAKDTKAMSNHCEFSRLLILGSFRNKMQKNGKHQNVYAGKERKGNWLQRQFIPYAPVGLFRAACEIAAENGIENCFSIMEPRHLKAMHRLGINRIQNLGEPIEYHGIRQPFALNLFENYTNGFLNSPDTWVIMADGGRIHSKIQDLTQMRQEIQSISNARMPVKNIMSFLSLESFGLRKA